MAKRKKNESIAAFRKRVSNDEIMDTAAGPIICNTDNNSNILLETRLKEYRKDNIVFSMRMNEDLLNRIKQAARIESAKRKADVPYQMLICEAIEDKYPMSKEK